MAERPYKGPHPTVGFPEKVANVAMPPLTGGVSGEVTAGESHLPLGVVRVSGSIVGVELSVISSGKDDTNTLSIAGDVLINETSIFTTKPAIAHVSGEAAQHKTTHEDASDTGITEAVINASACSFEPGDIITWGYEITRTASPTSEISTPSILVELLPEN